MKKIKYCVICCALLFISACKPLNPPEEKETQKILNLLCEGMEKSGEQLFNSFKELGIPMQRESISLSDYDEGFHYRSRSYYISFMTKNDIVGLIEYELYFKGNFKKCADTYLPISNLIYDCSWDKWMGWLMDDKRGGFTQKADRPEFLSMIQETVPTCNNYSVIIHEDMGKYLGENMVHGRVVCNATCDRDTLTNEKLSSIAECHISAQMELCDDLDKYFPKEE